MSASLQHQHEIGAGRDAPALLHRRIGDRARLERIEVLGALVVERDLDDRRADPAPSFSGASSATAALDHAGVDQSLHAAQARGRRRHGRAAARSWLDSEASCCSNPAGADRWSSQMSVIA